MKKLRLTRQALAVIALDILMICACDGLALLLRFDFSVNTIPEQYRTACAGLLPIQIVLTVAIFWFRRMYHYVWRSVNAQDVAQMLLSVVLASLLSIGAGALLGFELPLSVAFLIVFFQVILMVGMRCTLRIFDALTRSAHRSASRGHERIMMIGAGEAGRVLLRESLFNADAKGEICCLIDDNPEKWGKYLNGVPIVGGRDRIIETAREMEIGQIIFAIPSLNAGERRKILTICQQTGCRLRILPEIYTMVDRPASLAAVKDVQMEDLLAREPVKLDTAALKEFLCGKTVLVTGGGGSIGSELCRQIAAYAPAQLVIVDIYENNAYDIQQELLHRYGKDFPLRVEIASVRDKLRVYSIFERYHPDVVFHAAAHKHVPLMEGCAQEAVKNNIFGTYHVVRAAEKYGVRKFVMISTDKAVNPTNVMGASKRFCEMILQSRSHSETEFCCVRFGNVLGSNGSVVPLFKKQIESGGPLTITDKRIIRYFMTIPEASQLVLQAGAMAKQGQIYVLDMGEPVKILELAENLIRLMGYEPYKDIQICETGLRPGEKLYEELLMRSETLSATCNEKIFVEQQQAISADEIMGDLQVLDRAVTEGCTNEQLVELLRRMVPTYHSPEEVNRAAEKHLHAEDRQMSFLDTEEQEWHEAVACSQR